MRFSANLIALAAVTAACSDSPATRTVSAAAPATSGQPAVAATVDGVDIRTDELERRAAGKLARVRQEEFEVRQQVLDEIINEKLIEKEAKARGLSTADLVKAEIDDKVGRPTEAEVDDVYNRARAQLGGRPKEQVRPEIERYLQQQKKATETERFHQSLRAKSKVAVLLDAPRVEVKVASDAPSVGSAKAPVTLVEFTDYQCGFCQRAQETVDQLLAKYGDKVRFVHQDFPLENHPRAFFASRAARCANEQGKYWEFHRDMLKQPTDFSDGDLKGRAAKLKLDTGAFDTCVDSSRHDEAIRAAFKAGQDLGVSGTPTFFINGRVLYGARPKGQFEQIIDQELTRTASN